MPNLGDKLRALEFAKAEEDASRAAAAARHAETEEQKRLAAILEFFEQTKRFATESINAGKIPGQFTVPHHSPANGTNDILSKSHKDHQMFAAFKEWARSEGMDVRGQNSDNGAKFTVLALPRDA
jgi:hypothetical protein